MYKLDIYIRKDSLPMQFLEDLIREWFYKDKAEYAVIHGMYAPPTVNYYYIYINICGFKRKMRIINDCPSKEIEEKLYKIFKDACFTSEHDLYKCNCSKKDFSKAILSFQCVGIRNTKATLSYNQQIIIYKLLKDGYTRKEVAKKLRVSSQTIKDVYRKIQYAIEHGQINVD